MVLLPGALPTQSHWLVAKEQIKGPPKYKSIEGIYSPWSCVTRRLPCEKRTLLLLASSVVLRTFAAKNQTKEVFVWPQGHMKTMLYGNPRACVHILLEFNPRIEVWKFKSLLQRYKKEVK